MAVRSTPLPPMRSPSLWRYDLPSYPRWYLLVYVGTIYPPSPDAICMAVRSTLLAPMLSAKCTAVRSTLLPPMISPR
eukprot:1964571-Rhodomonas_salina.1